MDRISERLDLRRCLFASNELTCVLSAQYTATSPLDTVVKIDPMPTEPNSGLHGSDIGEECSLEAVRFFFCNDAI